MRRSQIYKTLLLWLLLYIWLSAWLNRPWEVFFLYYSLLLIKYGWKKCWTTTTTTTTISSSRNRRQNATQRSNESICQEATDSVMWYNDDNNIYTFIWFRKKKTKTLFKMMNLTPLINTTGPLNYSNSILEASEDEDSSSSSLLLAGSRNHTVSLPRQRNSTSSSSSSCPAVCSTGWASWGWSGTCSPYSSWVGRRWRDPQTASSLGWPHTISFSYSRGKS